MIVIKFIIKTSFTLYLKIVLLTALFFSKKIILFHSNGFGDYIQACIEHYDIIIKNNLKIFCFSEFQFEICSLIFEQKNIFRLSFLLSKKIHTSVILNNFNNLKFLKSRIIKFKSTPFSTHNKKRIFKKKISKFNFTRKLKSLSKEKYACLFFKNYDFKINNLSGSAIRQSTDIQKFIKIIEYLNLKNIKVVILGNELDKGTNLLEKKLNESKNQFNFEFFRKIDPNYEFKNLVYLCSNSKFYVGNSSGAIEIFYYLQKNAVIFDHFDDGYIRKYNLTNRQYLLKKVKVNNKTYYLNKNIIKKILDQKILNYKIQENLFSEIKKKIEKLV